MLDLDQSSTTSKPKCLFTSTRMARFLDHEQPPTKKRPFSTTNNQTFTHTLDLLLPTPSTPSLSILTTLTTPYVKIHLPLLSLLANPFFTSHIKTPSSSSSTLLISKQRERTYALSNGVLTLRLDKPTLSRTGLQATRSLPSKGKKHEKEIFELVYDLRSPSMLHGKPGFERLLWAAKNVLNGTVTWLAYFPPATSFPAAWEEHAPQHRSATPSMTSLEKALVPSFSDFEFSDPETAMEILEFLSLAGDLASPRVQTEDGMDSSLSRYQVPTPASPQPQDLVRLRWKGLIPAAFAREVFIAALKASGADETGTDEEKWMSISATAFDGASYTILVHGGKAEIWEYKE